MPLQAFSFPVPETRFFQTDNFIYKFKIRGGSSGKEVRGDRFNQEMEEIIRSVLGNLDRLQPFSTSHYNVFPYKKRWKRVHDRSETHLYPFTIVLYLEENVHDGKHTDTEKEEDVVQHIRSVSDEPRSKRRRRDSPLEEAILQDLIKDMEAEIKMSVPCFVQFAPKIHRIRQNKQPHKVGLGRHHAEVEVSKDPALPDKPETAKDADPEEGAHVKPGILKRVVSYIFPFLFRSTES